MTHNFLRKLELQGFKSFASKTVLEFPARIVAIVGPNGSGKSNIIDAFRWVLGEREAKHLRGDTFESLIFGGTEKRASVSLARVSLLFDNHDKLFPLDAPEVEISRRIDRSGTSEFFLRDSEIKLKDLSPILARARLGSRGITMIGQGQGDLFVKSSADERRTMIEEVLGLKEYRIKKTQAERRFDTTESNMEKTRALISEIVPHLRMLIHQKQRWEKRSEIAEKLTTLENRYFSLKYKMFEESLKRFESPSRASNDGIEKKRVAIVELEKKLLVSETRAFDMKGVQIIRADVSRLLSEKIEAEKQYARYEARAEIRGDATLSSRSSTELTEILKSVSYDINSTLDFDDISKIKSALRTISEKIGKLFTKGQKAPSLENTDLENRKQLEEQITVIDKRLAELWTREKTFLRDQENARQKFRVEIRRVEDEKNNLHKLEQETHGMLFEKEKIMLKMEDVEHDWLALGRTKEELISLPKYDEEIDFSDAERKIFRLHGELSAIGEIDKNLVKEADETEKRHTFLTKELEDLEKAKVDLQTLVKELDEQIHKNFKLAFGKINDEFNNYFQLMFGGGKAKMKLSVPKPMLIEEGEEIEKQVARASDPELSAGVEMEITIPRKRITSLDMLSGGEKSLVSLAALFALISVSPPPFLVLDEIDAPLDEENAARFAELVKEFSRKTQFVIVTHNRATMEAADVLYGITMGNDGVSKVFSLKLER